MLDDVEFVGGDLPAIVGGGGIKLDRNTATECFNRLQLCLTMLLILDTKVNES